MTQRKPPNLDWESFADQLTREAIEEGKFDHLPGFGKPLPGIDEPYDENRWLREKLREERIEALPPGLALRKRVEQETARILALSSEEEVRKEVDAVNQMIARENLRITYGPPANVMPLAADAIVDEWRSQR